MNYIKQTFFLLCFILAWQFGHTQASVLGNSFGSSNDYLGWDADTRFPLYIRHNNNKPIIFETDGIQRMRLEGDGRLFVGNVGSANY